MKGGQRPFTCGVLWLMLGVLCWCAGAGAWAAHGLIWRADRVSFRDPGGQAEFKQLKELRREMELEGGGHVTGWGQSLRETVLTKANGETATVDALWLDGDASAVWTPRVTSGQLPAANDTIGCALDHKTALKLFGSLNIAGQEVLLAEEWMTVRGTFELPEGLSALGADPGRGLALCPAALAGEDVHMTALDFIAVKPAGDKTAKEQAEKWLATGGLGGGTGTAGDDSSLADHLDESDLMNLATTLPGFILAALAILELARALGALARRTAATLGELRLDRLTPPELIARTLLKGFGAAVLIAAAGALTLLLPVASGKLPASYLPTRWSDFGFWGRLAEQLLQSQAQARLLPALRADLAARALRNVGATLALASVPMFFLARRAMARGHACAGAPRKVALCALVCAVAPAALFIARFLDWVAVVPGGMPYLPVAFYLALTLMRERPDEPWTARLLAPRKTGRRRARRRGIKTRAKVLERGDAA